MEVREIDGASFEHLEMFCVRFSRSVLFGQHEWHGNLDALNDILRGGFGTPRGPWVLRWRNASRSREVLGQTLFETILEIVRDHGVGGAEPEDGVTLELED